MTTKIKQQADQCAATTVATNIAQRVREKKWSIDKAETKLLSYYDPQKKLIFYTAKHFGYEQSLQEAHGIHHHAYANFITDFEIFYHTDFYHHQNI